MTLRKFMRLYRNYQKTFDIEMILNKKGITYDKLAELEMQNEEWFK